jgi:CheY-like chemotaxis protein/nitrogen-specific signal transduction histidine kinase
MSLTAPLPKSTAVSRRRFDRERSARREAERLLETKSRELFTAEQTKTAFLATISHELRTPINGVLGAAQVLADTSLDGEQRRYVETISTCGASLLTLVNAVLDLVAIDSGRIKLKAERFDLVALLDEIVGTFRPITADKGLSLDLMIDAGLSRRCFVGDQIRLRHVLLSLVSNAVKYTQAGKVRVTAQIDDDGQLRLTVDDSGRGVDEADRQRIFERFERGEMFATRREEGAGLGLSLARELVELMGGRIGVGSSALGGASFWFTVPLPDARCGEGEPAPLRTSELTGRRVLIVDDNPVNRMIACAAVRTAKMVHATAENGAEALEMLEREEFDCVLMDIQMPVMSGDEAIRRIRASDRPYRNIPIIVVTAHAVQGNAAPFLNIGANDMMEKPLAFDHLVGRMSTLLPAANAA